MRRPTTSADKYNLSTMAAHACSLTRIEQRLMRQFGARLARARAGRRLSATAFAAQLRMSRTTLRAAERGDPAVTMGTYMRILTALDLAGGQVPVFGTAEASDRITRRKKLLEAQVVAGTRDARSLVAIPRKMAKESRVTFPKYAFGKVRPW